MSSVFETDRKRAALADAGDFAGLLMSYQDGEKYPDLPDMNSPAVWDFHAKNSTTSGHPVTKRRIEVTAAMVRRLGRILDIGCGYGDIIEALGQGAFTFTGMDFSPNFITALSAKYPQHSFFRRPLKDMERSHYDTVMALEVLEHLPAKTVMDFYREIQGVMAPEAEFIVSVPCGENLEWITYVCAHCEALQNVNGHVRSYTPNLLKAEMTLAGFRIVETNGALLPGNLIVKAVIK